MESYIQTAEHNQHQAYRIISELKIIESWEAIGAKINLIGSLKMGLLMKHLDIDFHVYTETMNIAQCFQAIASIAKHQGVKSVQFGNLLENEDQCLEWHIIYLDENNQEWQIDIIHILKGSTYDGYFEQVADAIVSKLKTQPEYRNIILRLKWETPDDNKIMGVEYYQAVLEGNVKTMDEFQEYRQSHPVKGIINWCP